VVAPSFFFLFHSSLHSSFHQFLTGCVSRPRGPFDRSSRPNALNLPSLEKKTSGKQADFLSRHLPWVFILAYSHNLYSSESPDWSPNPTFNHRQKGVLGHRCLIVTTIHVRRLAAARSTNPVRYRIWHYIRIWPTLPSK